MSVTNDIVEYIIELCESEERLELSNEVFVEILRNHQTELVSEIAQAIAEQLITAGIKIV